MRTASRRASAALTLKSQVSRKNTISARARRADVHVSEVSCAVKLYPTVTAGEEDITPLKRGCWRLHRLS
eukprot:6139947-Prymnesium_polylepis.1